MPDTIERLATVLIREDSDLTEVYEALQPLMAPQLFRSLGLHLDLCPIHLCDIQICKDDGEHGDEVYV